MPDGQPVRWALNLLHGAELSDRVYGPDLMLKTCRLAADNNLSIYLLGGTDELLAKLTRRLGDRFPNLEIARARASRFRTLDGREKQELVDDINRSGASVLCVGLGCPRQEIWAYEFQGPGQHADPGRRRRIQFPRRRAGTRLRPCCSATGSNGRTGWRRSRAVLWRRYLILNPYYLGFVGRPAARSHEAAFRSRDRGETHHGDPSTAEPDPPADVNVRRHDPTRCASRRPWPRHQTCGTRSWAPAWSRSTRRSPSARVRRRRAPRSVRRWIVRLIQHREVQDRLRIDGRNRRQTGVQAFGCGAHTGSRRTVPPFPDRGHRPECRRGCRQPGSAFEAHSR